MKALLSSSLLLIVLAHIVSVMSLRKFETVGMVPNSYFEDQKTIYCFVERCIDGDTIRCRHIPGYSWRLWERQKLCQPLKTRGIANQTLSIRIYGVDCPEIAKNKRQTTQPFGEDAHEFTKSLVLHSVVRITFLRRDQYGRAVAAVQTIPKFPFLPTPRKDLSVQLAKHGLAELYTGGGAEYWNKKDVLEQCITQAKRRKLGIWSMSERVSAAEHKKMLKENLPLQETTNYINYSRGGNGGDSNKNMYSKSHPANKKNDSSSKKNHKPSRKANLLEAAITGLELVA